MCLRALIDIGVNRADAHADLVRPLGILAINRRTTGFAEISGLAGRGMVSRQVVGSRNDAEVLARNNAVGRECTALRLAATGTVAAHDIPNAAIDFVFHCTA